jgi:radical S-adenosyl methionine domain-containing protein 2
MKIFETVSFHIVKPCNMKCKFCYATFEDMHVGAQMSLEHACTVITKLYLSGVQKITFAGGEPLLYKHIDDCISFSKGLGMTTSIITNGSLITHQWLVKMQGKLDWIGISVDSLDPRTNDLIGRRTKMKIDYHALVNNINFYGFKLKINTVVNSFNKDEEMNEFLNIANPSRWKVFQALRVEGQNDSQFDEVKVSDDEFEAFLERHSSQVSLVPESNESMTASYLLIDPLGRLFENSLGSHTYSDSLINNNIEHCLSQISLDRDMFLKRGGVYEWA